MKRLLPATAALAPLKTLLRCLCALVLASSARAGTWTFSPWTNDASTYIASGQTVWAHHFGSTATATINGVSVPGLAGGASPVSAAGKFSITGMSFVSTSDTNNLTALGGSGSAVMAGDFIYGGNPGALQIQGLTAGQHYTVSIFSVGFEPSGRQVTLSTSTGIVVNQDQYGDNAGIRVDHTFTATAAAQTITFTPVVSGSTWHLYGLALRNETPSSRLTVTSLADSGAGSLRWALSNAADMPGADSITFAPALSGLSIILASEIAVNDTDGVTVDASSLPAGVILSGGGNVRQLALNSGSLTLRRITLAAGKGIGALSNEAGGAVRSLAGTTFAAYDCSFQSNSADKTGGAISSSGTVTVERCLFAFNNTRSDDGPSGASGAITNNGTLTVRNCTFYGNATFAGSTAGNSAGAILSFGAGGMVMEHCTLSANTSGGDGTASKAAVIVNTNATITNCILAGNTVADLNEGSGGVITLAGANIIITATGTALGGPPAVTTAPTLGALADNGGPTLTRALQAGSPGIDAAVGSTVTTDQRGFFRSGTADLGAFEFNGLNPLVVTTTADAGTGSLRWAISNAAALGGLRSISFASALSGETISLASEIVITSSVTLDATGLPAGLTVDDGTASTYRLFTMNSGQTVELRGLTLAKGGGTGLADAGAILNQGNLTLTRCTVTGCRSSNDAGALLNTGSGTLTLTQCTVSGNQTGNAGGAIRSTGTLSLTHCTVSGNTGGQGGGIHNSGPFTLTHSIVAGNSASGADKDILNNGASAVLTRNGASLVQFLLHSSGGSVAGSGSLMTSAPLLSPLASHGGPTQTMRLLSGSPALNAATGSAITTDQRGFAIIGTPDIGAYEVQIGGIPAQEAFVGTPTAAIAVPVGTVGTLSATSSVQGLVTGFNFGGSGTSRSLTITPSAVQTGTATITVTDSLSGDATSFLLTVNPPVSRVVTNSNDTGAGSMRQVIADSLGNAGPDIITFAPGLSGQTISLNSEIVMNMGNQGSITLDASSLPGGMTIDGGPGTNRIFGIFADDVSTSGALTLAGLTLTGGNGTGQSFNGSGGAILNFGATLTLARCTLSGNSADSGGAIANSGTLTLTECTLSGNSAAIYSSVIDNIEGTLTLTHCTISGNTGGDASQAIYNYNGRLKIENTIVAGNKGHNILNTQSGVTPCTFVSVGFNIVETTSRAGSVREYGSVRTIGLSANLAPLGNYGGPTQTMPPLPGSPALDSALYEPYSFQPTTDQRGLPRPLGIRSDVGAVESSILTITTGVDELDAPGVPGTGLSLREAIRDVPAGGTITFSRAVFTGPSTNTLTLTQGPLNPQRPCTLDGSGIPGGMKVVYQPTITAQPQSLSLASGAAVAFSVTGANLSGGLTHQWRKDENAIGSQVSSTLNLTNIQENDEAVYDVVLGEATAPGALTLTQVTLGAFAATSQPATLIVDGAPVVSVERDPANAMIALGSSHVLSVVAVGPDNAALRFQWKRNDTNISGATKSSHILTNAQLAHAGTYTCVVKAGVTSVTSAPAEIGVVDARPKTVNVAVNGKFTATVSAAGKNLTYLWSSGQNTPGITINPAGLVHAGLYTCTVLGDAGTFAGGAPTTLNIVVDAPMLLTPLALPVAVIGQGYYYQIPVIPTPGAPATSFSITGALPPGMTFDRVTGILSGRPTATKTTGYTLVVKAGNARGYSAPANVTLTVSAVPQGAVGVFAGPVGRSTLNGQLGGRFDLTTTGTGTCSGSITLGSRAKIPFTNCLLLSAGEGSVILRANLPNIVMPDKSVVTAYVEIFAAVQRAQLTLVHAASGTTVVSTGWRNPWHATTNKATDLAAYYTARLNAGQGGAVSPDGFGYLSFTVASAGTLTLAGKLPDGSGVTGGTFVGPDGQILLFNLLYANRGSHVGHFTITPAEAVADNTLSGETSWQKPGPLLTTSTDTVYKAGFGPLPVVVEGGVFVGHAAGGIVPGFTAVPPGPGQTNALFYFNLGGLDGEGKEFSQAVHLYNPSTKGTTNAIFVPTPVNGTRVPSFNSKTGLFSGSFQINGASAALNRPAPFDGMMVKIGATTQGYGFFLLPTATPKISTSPKLSGQMVLGAP